MDNLPGHREEKPREVCCLHHHLSSRSKDMGLWSKAPACSCLGQQHTPLFPADPHSAPPLPPL